MVRIVREPDHEGENKMPAPKRRNRPASLLAARFAGVLAICSSPVGCTHYARLDVITDELAAMSPPWFAEHRETFRAVLATSLSQDAYVCDPLPSEVFHGPAPQGWRTIRGTMPHYGLYYGPMQYDIRQDQGRWRVEVRYAVAVPEGLGDLELPDCELSDQLEGRLTCAGVPYARSGTLDACPGTGTFRARASRHNIEALLARWSWDAERYYNRDANAFGLPIAYDFSFRPIPSQSEADGPVHLRVPLSPTCGRTPYFQAMRSGWTMPILAHEVGHMLGLLDEYEMFSGIVGFYPKTPFRGADRSRFGLSMKEESVVLPLHHYLVLRRFFCPEPDSTDPYRHALPTGLGSAKIPMLRGLTVASNTVATETE